jgi:hypothetical protein
MALADDQQAGGPFLKPGGLQAPELELGPAIELEFIMSDDRTERPDEGLRS